jgi:hydrogenase maturation protease
MSEKIVILGMGNLLLTDDGIGPHAAQALASQPPVGASVADVGTDFLSALPFLDSARRALIIDAVRGGGTPGTIYRLTENDVAPQEAESVSSHALNLLQARKILSPGSPKIEIAILGVEPAVLTYGMELSPAVAAALPRVLDLTREIVMQWQDQDSICA